MARWTYRVTLAVLVLMSTGCNLTKFVADSMVPQLQNNQQAFFAETSVKQAREAAPALLKFMDGFIVSSPENSELLLLGAEMNAGLAIVLIRYEDETWARQLFTKAQDYAERALLADYPDLHAVLVGSDDEALAAALKELDRDQLPHAFWYVTASGGKIDVSRDQPDLVAGLSRLVQVMHRLAEIDGSFFDGGPDTFLGRFYASRSETLGGSPEKARMHFTKAESFASNRMWMVPVFRAEGLQNQELSRAVRDEYEAALNRVIEGEGPPEVALVTAIAKQKAVAMLADIDEQFPLDMIEILENMRGDNP